MTTAVSQSICETQLCFFIEGKFMTRSLSQSLQLAVVLFCRNVIKVRFVKHMGSVRELLQ